ncbi:MAG: sulfotransferase [Cyclobacteriaceae bacterium]
MNFMIIGAQKCGTTSLAAVLNMHPELCCSIQKETHFFSKEPNWRDKLDEYHSQFNEQLPIWFEGSTTYTFYPSFNKAIVDDLYEYNPNLKFLYIVRHPIERLVSAYKHLYERGYLSSSFSDAIRNYPDLLNITNYYIQIKRYIDRFGTDHVLIIDFERFNNRRQLVLKEVSNFLGIDPDLFPNGISNVKLNSEETKRLDYRIDRLNLSQSLVKRFLPIIWQLVVKLRYYHPVPRSIDVSQSDRRFIFDILKSDLRLLREFSSTLEAWKVI